MKRRFSTLAIATILGLSAGFANADPVKVKDILDREVTADLPAKTRGTWFLLSRLYGSWW